MSSIRFNCPHCDQPLEVTEDLCTGALQCPTCNGAIEFDSEDEDTATPPPKQHSKPKSKPTPMFDRNNEIKKYIFNHPPATVTRTWLNTMCGIGVFVFGWLLSLVFDYLGKKGLGWAYIIPVLFCFVLAAEAFPPIGLLGTCVYIAGWIHANTILTRYQRFAERRIQQLESEQSVDAILERGLLLHKVMGKMDDGAQFFAEACNMQGGDARLLYQAGVALATKKHFQPASILYQRAASRTRDAVLKKRINAAIKQLQKQSR
jgi:hypothetical protein